MIQMQNQYLCSDYTYFDHDMSMSSKSYQPINVKMLMRIPCLPDRQA